jgi:hypothetical protein
MRGQVFLVHWNAIEAESLAAPFRSTGSAVEVGVNPAELLPFLLLPAVRGLRTDSTC